MQYLLILLFLLRIQICLASPYLPDTVATASDYLALAKQYETEGISDQAIAYYELAKTQLMSSQDAPALVYILNKLASYYATDVSTHTKAEVYLDSALTLLDVELNAHDSLRALNWYNMAELKSVQRKFDEAIRYYQKSLERKQAMYGENHLEVADVWEKIGRIYLYRLQNPYKAEPFLEQALTIRESSDIDTRDYVNGFYHLAVANRLRADFEEALAYGFKALLGYEQLPEPVYRNILFAHSLLGSIYLDMDSLEKALQYNTKAIQLAQQQNLSQKIDMSLHYNNQAVYHFQAKNFDSTIYYAQLAINEQTGGENLASSYQFLGNAYWGKGQMDKAFLNYQKSSALKEEFFAEPHVQLATLYIDLGRAFETNLQPDSALYYYHKALANAKSSQNHTDAHHHPMIQAGDDLATTEEGLVKIKDLLISQYHETGDLAYLSQALRYFFILDHFVDICRTDFSSEGSKLLLSGKHKATYEQAIAISYTLYQSTQADSLLQGIFHFMEKSNALVLLESIHQAEKYQGVLPDSLSDQKQSLQTQLAYYASELIDAEQDTDKASEVSYWQLQKANVLREMDTLNQYIQTHYPQFYHITYRDLSVDMDSLQRQITSDQAFISYFWGDSAVYALMITSDNLEVQQIKNVGKLQQALHQYLDVLTTDAVLEPSFANFQQFQENAHQLYKLLLEPMLKEKSIDRLTLVLDGELTKIPFESLISSQIKTENHVVRYKDLPYLIKDYEISYEFSLSIAFWEQYSDQVFSSENDVKVAAFGIKKFDQLSEGQQYPPLGGAEREVRYIQDKFPQAHIFLNAAATETEFKRHAPEADILHIATHGLADMDNPFASKFIFYPGENEDGILNLYELYSLPLKAKILFLSGCDSGVGKHYKGEGNFSLARSFIYAGSQSVVMSLWQVNDLMTEQVIKGIYDRIHAKQPISQALRETKMAMIEDGLFAHPQCWAGMVPLGNAQIQFPPQNDEAYLLLGFILLGGGAIFLVHRLLVLKYKPLMKTHSCL